MQDGTAAGNLIQTQFQEGKTAAIIDGPWKAQAFKDAKVKLRCCNYPKLFQTVKTTQPLVVVKLGSSHQALRTLKGAQKFVDFLVSTEEQKSLLRYN